jgi:hypothetical protein
MLLKSIASTYDTGRRRFESSGQRTSVRNGEAIRMSDPEFGLRIGGWGPRPPPGPIEIAQEAERLG